jgi:transcriptional regulator with XRE-family HTH domain
LTQADLAKALGIEYYSAISAIEVGRNSVPPERYADFARCLRVEPKEFIKKILELTNPWAYAMLFLEDPYTEIEKIKARFDGRFGQKAN